MLAKLIVEGREFPIEIQDPELQKLLTPKKKTGYERIKGKKYYWVHADFSECETDEDDVGANQEYDCANYYSDDTVAMNNARADKLMRQLRRFAVEHRSNNSMWENDNEKYYIYYSHNQHALSWCFGNVTQVFGTIYFDSETDVTLAIKTFHDELIWYFTEYKDSL